MDPFFWVLIAGAFILGVALGAAFMWYSSTRRSRQLKSHFGPEYDRTVAMTGDRELAEAELHQREQRVRSFDITPLHESERVAFGDRWRLVQSRFVDEPEQAVAEADGLIKEVMHTRGYPVEHFEQQAADLSVDYPRVVEHYRAAHDIAMRSARGEASTEDLRQAMVHYRALFADLVGASDDDRLRTTQEIREDRHVRENAPRRSTLPRGEREQR